MDRFEQLQKQIWEIDTQLDEIRNKLMEQLGYREFINRTCQLELPSSGWGCSMIQLEKDKPIKAQQQCLQHVLQRYESGLRNILKVNTSL